MNSGEEVMVHMDTKIKRLIAEVLGEIGKAGTTFSDESSAQKTDTTQPDDLTVADLKEQLLVPAPANREAYLKAKETTVSRIGIWRAGPRYLTKSLLRFSADHAIAQFAVFHNVSEAFVKDWGLLEIKTRCKDKDQFLTNPTWGESLMRKIPNCSENIARRKPGCRFILPTVSVLQR